jgi:hypothetical protein
MHGGGFRENDPTRPRSSAMGSPAIPFFYGFGCGTQKSPLPAYRHQPMHIGEIYFYVLNTLHKCVRISEKRDLCVKFSWGERVPRGFRSSTVCCKDTEHRGSDSDALAVSIHESQWLCEIWSGWRGSLVALRHIAGPAYHDWPVTCAKTQKYLSPSGQDISSYRFLFLFCIFFLENKMALLEG